MDAIFAGPYATAIGDKYAGTKSISYIKVTSIHQQKLSKKDTIWKIDVNNLSVLLLRGLLLLFLDKRDDFANKNKEFYNPSINKILATINGMPHQLFAARLQVRDIYEELKKHFYKKLSNVTWGEFLTTKFGLWIDIRTSTDNTLRADSRTVENSDILLQTEKAAETSDGDLTCYVFSLEDAVAHLAVTHPSGILTIEK